MVTILSIAGVISAQEFKRDVTFKLTCLRSMKPCYAFLPRLVDLITFMLTFRPTYLPTYLLLFLDKGFGQNLQIQKRIVSAETIRGNTVCGAKCQHKCDEIHQPR